jgi:hypothetical protein
MVKYDQVFRKTWSRANNKKERGSLRIGINSLGISWLGSGVSRVLRINASEPVVGWKGEHP